jgi:uncharacterized protein (DUF1499 family)
MEERMRNQSGQCARVCAGILIFLVCCSAKETASGDSNVSGVSPTDFANLERSDSPNSWLVAPADFAGGKPDEESPVFDVAPRILAEAWMQVLRAQPRTTITGVFADGLHIEADQKSALFGFVDRISARVLPLAASRSTLIVYSRSQVGYWDLGVNRSRVQQWLADLRARVANSG